MYRLESTENLIEGSSWGSFSVNKSFDVYKSKNNTDINGFIVQHVTKNTDANVLCQDNKIRKINNIDEFTSDKVKYMNHNYWELFPVLDGEAVYDDSFSNGAVLRYKKEGRDWYAYDNPPTEGKITQKGEFFFIKTEKDLVDSVLKFMDVNKRKRTPVYIKIFNIDWDVSKIHPANGLPYTTDKKASELINFTNSNILKHNVNVKWNGISNIPLKANNINTNIKMNHCKLVNNNNIPTNKEKGITIVKSKISEI
jgi:hypothetical protein